MAAAERLCPSLMCVSEEHGRERGDEFLRLRVSAKKKEGEKEREKKKNNTWSNRGKERAHPKARGS